MNSDCSDTDGKPGIGLAGLSHGQGGDVTKEAAHEPMGKTPQPPPGAWPCEIDYHDPESPLDPVTWTRESELAADLTAEVKAEILRQGAGRRQLRIKRRDITASEAFFLANPKWTAADLLGLWQACGRFGDADAGWDRLWHARRGKDFKFLLLNLDRVVGQLGVAGKVPQLVTVVPGKLYKPRRPRDRKSGKADPQ